MNQNQFYQYAKENEAATIEEKHKIQGSIKSNLVDQYYSLMSGTSFHQISQDKFASLLLNEGVHYSRTSFSEHLLITLEQYTSNYEALKLNVKYGYLCTSLNIINVDNQRKSLGSGQSFSGSFGSISKQYFQMCPYAIKTIKFIENKFESTFRDVIKECFLLKIASALRIGPYIRNLFGFDIIAYRNCFDFSMEFCQGPSSKDMTISLKRNLNILHHFNIVHLDIKPENISFSQKYNEYVFIDFGLSRAIKEEIGEKSQTRFTGSFIYCCNEMLDLYTNETTGLVDLYYNDVFCLYQSLKRQKQEVVHSQQSLYLMDGPIGQFETNEKILINKFQLFKLACGTVEIELFKELFCRLNITHLHDYILNLPQQLNILSCYKQILNDQSQYEEKITEKVQGNLNKSLIEIPQLFVGRFNQIVNIGKEGNSYSQLQRQSEQQLQMLIDGQALKQTRFGLYCLSLIRFIKMNSGDHPFEQKLRACRVYSEFYLKQIDWDSDTALYRKVIQSIFETSLSSNQPEKQEILRNVIETVAILEAISEGRFIEGYFAVFDWGFNFIQTIRLAFQFITSLQFIKEKIQKTYNYERLLHLFMKKLNSYTDEMCTKLLDSSDWLIAQKIKELVTDNVGQYAGIIPSISLFQQQQFAKNPLRKHSMQSGKLNGDLDAYIYFVELTKSMNQYSYKQLYLQKLIAWINTINHYSKKFTYVHHLVFRIFLATNQYQITQTIYQHFYRQFREHKEHTQFQIYLLSKISIIKFVLSRTLVSVKDNVISRIPNKSDDSFELDELFRILDYFIKNSGNFYLPLSQLLYIPGIQYSTCIKYLYELISKNREKIAIIPYQTHQNGKHNDYLKKHILLLNNILEFIQRYYQVYEDQTVFQLVADINTSLNECKDLIVQNSCLECKVQGVFELKLVVFSEQKLDDKISLMLELLIIAFKHSQLRESIFPIMLLMIRISAKYNQKSIIYDIKPLFYEYIRDKGKMHYCLFNFREQNIFISIYLMLQIRYPKEETLHFIHRLVQSLGKLKSATLVDQFYYSVDDMVQTSKKDHHQQFKYWHDQIIYAFMQNYKLKLIPYICLYFAALLQLKIKVTLQQRILKRICLSINSLDFYARSIVLNRYYYLYSFYQTNSLRKNNYLKAKYFKYSLDKIPLKFLLRNMIKMCKQSAFYQFIVLAKLRARVKKYHQNIDNIK